MSQEDTISFFQPTRIMYLALAQNAKMRGVTVTELFQKANLMPRGPVPDGTCETNALQIRGPAQSQLKIDVEYENRRWLSNEAILYIGKADHSIHRRVAQFYPHRCGDRSPHAGGQILLLLGCLSDLWVYYSRADDPRSCESIMLRFFEQKIGKPPFANSDGKRRPRRVQTLA